MVREEQPMMGRVAGAPISWGVCEVPGWGYQLPADRVLAEMAAMGLAATEFGPAGDLPADPVQRSRLLAEQRLSAAGGLVPVVLHAPGGAEREAGGAPGGTGRGGGREGFGAVRSATPRAWRAACTGRSARATSMWPAWWAPWRRPVTRAGTCSSRTRSWTARPGTRDRSGPSGKA